MEKCLKKHHPKKSMGVNLFQRELAKQEETKAD